MPEPNQPEPRLGAGSRSPVRVAFAVLALVSLPLALASCGDDDDVTPGSGPRSEDTSGEFDDYLGLSVDEATDKADDDGRPSRVVRIDGEDLAVTMDFVEDRLNFEVQDDQVTAVTTG